MSRIIWDEERQEQRCTSAGGVTSWHATARRHWLLAFSRCWLFRWVSFVVTRSSGGRTSCPVPLF
jgi:hypothetical protein